MRLVFRLAVMVFLAGLAAPAFAQDAGEAKLGADELAKKVVEATGDPTELDKLAFTFVVEKEGKAVVSRRHIWKPKAGELEVKAGEQTIELTQLHDHDLSKLADDPKANAETWKKIAPKSTPEEAAKAWAWFVNDSYWLLVPSKLFDPGVNRKLDEQGRLVLTFGDVGLTPGDRYMMTVDRDNWQVKRWDFVLESGRKGGFAWTDYKKVGPLELSTKRVADGGNFVIRFEDVEAGE
ncbi:hypothetical protein FIV42_23055 [Persicimonas caeni]|uniref:Outer membrane lipoprotein-sorting protein n=1 Tax=Persicimonas caeni TaxID=2292766 RepID=A0A4Y6PZS9_PERCE|nr:hypothetical protein [Persicimonas caeni]QDG53517.1 hypothetical protein FIV42_23055 [Persicimonas caeni]QED34738.1 hypothetical protein FRD00_23050 [Persicimonas caeni]